MTNPWSTSSSKSASPWSGGGSTATTQHHPHGVGGFLENLGKDVSGAVTGFIPGTVHLVLHPIPSIEEMGKSTWQTWSPLFHGHVGQFAHNVYDHPLQPILDVASIFDLGLGAAGKLGELSTAADELASSDSMLAKAARLRQPKRVQLEDPTGEGRLAYRNYSTRPLRRLMQEHVSPTIRAEQKLSRGEELSPLQTGLANASFQRAFRGAMLERTLAKSTIVNAMVRTGKTLTDPETAPAARRKLAEEGIHQNLYDHGHLMTPEEAVAQLQTKAGGHMRPVADVSQIHFQDGSARVQTLQRKLKGLVQKSQKHAYLAQSLPKLQAELERHEAELKDMHENGYRIAAPAKSKLKEPTDKQLIERNAAPIKEKEANIANLRKLIERAGKSDQILKDTHEKIDLYGQQLIEAKKQVHNSFFDKVASSSESFDEYARHAGKWSVVRGRTPREGYTADQAAAMVSKAMVNEHGMVSLVPTHDAYNLGRELDHTSKMFKMLWRKPTRAWKMAVVGYTPRTIVNNGVGNLLIYLSREDPLTGLWGLYHGFRVSHGIEKATADWFDTRTKSGLLRKYFGPSMANVYGHDELEAAAAGGKLSRFKSGAYPLVHKLADIPVRAGAVLSYLRRDPLVMKYMKAGQSFEAAAERALKEDPGLKARATDHATAIGGDYVNISPGMRKLMDVVPFALWDRHILRSTSNLVKDTPTRAAIGQQVSQQGESQVDKLLGNVPSYMKGALPLSMLGLGSSAGERVNVLTTTSLNPFSTIGELASTAQALTAGHSPDASSDLFSQVNPFLTGLASYATGTGIGGTQITKHGGAIPSVLFDTLQGIPEYKIAQGLTTPGTTLTKTGKEKLLATGPSAAATSFLGVPIRSVGKQAAAKAADQEAGIKKGRKRTKNPYS